MIQDALNRIENGVVELQMIVLHIEVENGVGTRLRPENTLIGPLASSQDVAFTADQHVSAFAAICNSMACRSVERALPVIAPQDGV
ncbi:hypothetical protein [Bradyrhizobium sp. S3.2.12]|uniref:hypothetical protein n=1 Tax=Bradyrhizobium sp. S3.2.12 TaxID=3156387 RepID=UPI0033952CF2